MAKRHTKVDLSDFISGKRKANRATDAEALALLAATRLPRPKPETHEERKARLVARREWQLVMTPGNERPGARNPTRARRA